MDRKKFTDYAISIDSSEVSRCIICHDPVCTGVCPQNTPVGDILRSLYFENYMGAVGQPVRGARVVSISADFFATDTEYDRFVSLSVF